MEANSPPSLSLQQEAANKKTSGARLEELASESAQLAQRVASNPSAPPALLRRLAGSENAPTRKNVAANPNTPTEVLLELGAEFPEELLSNPVFSLLLLENPKIAESISTKTLASLVRLETVPVSLVKWAETKVDVLKEPNILFNLLECRLNNNKVVPEALLALALANNPKTSVAALEKLAEWEGVAELGYRAVPEAAQLHVSFAGEMTEGWDWAAHEKFWDIYFYKKPQTWHSPSEDEIDLEYLKLLEYMNRLPQVLISTLPEGYSSPLARMASNPNTPVRVLEQLALDRNREVRKNVASNPNTPFSLLAKLAKDSDWRVRKNVALHPHTPYRVVQELAKDTDLRVGSSCPSINSDRYYCGSRLCFSGHKINREIAKDFPWNPNTPASLLEQLALDSDRDVRKNVASNPNTPASILEKLALDRDREVCRAVASNPNTPASLLEKLALDSHLDVCSSVALNANTPVTVLMQLALEMSSKVRQSLASNPNTPVSVLIQLEKEGDGGQDSDGVSDWEVGQTLGTNPKPAVRIVLRLTKEGKLLIFSGRAVPQTVAANPNAPVSLLMELGKDSDVRVRQTVAANPNTPVSLLVELGKDSDVPVRQTVAANPNTPASLLVELGKDRDRSVCQTVAANPNTPVSLLVEFGKDSDLPAQQNLASNSHTPVSLFEELEKVKLEKDHYQRVRQNVAANPSTPVRLLVEFGRDSDVPVRQNVAKNPSTPASLLVELAKDTDSRIRTQVAQNPNTPVSVLEKLLSDPEDRVVQITVMRYLADSPDGLPVVLQHYPKDSTADCNWPVCSWPRYSRLFILLHPQVPSHVLAENSRSLVWWYRYAVAQHPNTPPDTLTTLAGDANRIVRAAARANLQNRQNQP